MFKDEESMKLMIRATEQGVGEGIWGKGNYRTVSYGENIDVRFCVLGLGARAAGFDFSDFSDCCGDFVSRHFGLSITERARLAAVNDLFGPEAAIAKMREIGFRTEQS